MEIYLPAGNVLCTLPPGNRRAAGLVAACLLVKKRNEPRRCGRVSLGGGAGLTVPGNRGRRSENGLNHFAVASAGVK